jgi:hypothetical protein
MRTLLLAFLAGVVGYVVGVVVGIILVNIFSSNQFDRSMEAVMTGFFASGPLCALGAIVLFCVVRLFR